MCVDEYFCLIHSKIAILSITLISPLTFPITLTRMSIIPASRLLDNWSIFLNGVIDDGREYET